MMHPKVYPVTRKSIQTFGMVLLLVSAGALTCARQATGQKKSAPTKSAPAPKAAPSKPAASAARPGGAASGGGAKTSAAGGAGAKTGAAGGAGTRTGGTGGGTSAKGGTSTAKQPGTVTKNSNGTTTKQTAKGEVTKTPTGKVQAFKSNDGKTEAKFGSNGKVKEVHAEAKGGGKLTVARTPNGARRTEIVRADHSRVVAYGHGRGYIEHRYEYGGHAYYARGYYYNGGYYRSYYHPYYYGGVQLYGYAPSYYYPAAYYGWAYNPWPSPAPYAWGWGGSPWYGYYGAYFAPYPVYPSPAFWLTDYLVAATLTAAYEAAAANAALNPDGPTPMTIAGPHLVLASYSPGRHHGPSDDWEPADGWGFADAGGTVALTPEVKKAISNEIQSDLAAEKAQPAASADAPGVGTLGTLLADGKPHIFVAGAAITADYGSQDCSITDGDVLSLPSAPAKDAEKANLTVLASKQSDCVKGNTVAVSLTDLQEMQNHLLASVEKGMGEMKDKGAKNGLPAPPADAVAGSKEAPYAAAAPPPDKNGAADLDAASNEGAQTEQQVTAEAEAADGGTEPQAASAGTAPGNAVAAAPDQSKMQTISAGQTIAQVVAMKGQPKQKFVLSASKVVYVYSDLKITFVNGKLADAE